MSGKEQYCVQILKSGIRKGDPDPGKWIGRRSDRIRMMDIRKGNPDLHKGEVLRIRVLTSEEDKGTGVSLR